jgi:TatD DNase family protein
MLIKFTVKSKKILMYFDTHTHLYSEEFNDDRSAMIERAINAGISRFYLPNVDSESIEGMLALEKQYPGVCFPMMGLHPCSVKEDYRTELDLVRLWLEKRPFCAIGEIGMDLYWDKTFVKEQEIAFREQIDLALQYQYPIIIHCRDAFNEIFEVLDSYQTIPKGIFHCFSGNQAQAEKILSYSNFMLGIGGVLTFKNSGLDKVIEHIDLKHLVLETDAPYLAPAPHRGKRNESSYLSLVAQKLADIKHCSLETISSITSQNAISIFEN